MTGGLSSYPNGVGRGLPASSGPAELTGDPAFLGGGAARAAPCRFLSQRRVWWWDLLSSLLLGRRGPYTVLRKFARLRSVQAGDPAWRPPLEKVI